MRYDLISMLPLRAFSPLGGRMTLEGGKGSPPPPDYRPVAEASAESARIMGALGEKQLAFNERQYEESKPFLADIAEHQKGIADQAAAQGQDYFDYLKTFRPIEGQMMNEAMVDRSSEIADYDAANRADADTMTMSKGGLYAANRGAIDEDVGRAVADAEGGYTRAVNQAVRQGLRYGAAAPNMVGQVGNLGLAQASSIASAANGARDVAIQDVRARAGSGLQLRTSNMNNVNAQRAIDWAKKLDAAGLVKGLPGASTGAYGLAVQAGNSAGQNQMAPGAAAQAGMAAGANTIGSGQQMRINGLSGIMNSQTSLYQPPADNTGAIVGGVAGIGVALI